MPDPNDSPARDPMTDDPGRSPEQDPNEDESQYGGSERQAPGYKEPDSGDEDENAGRRREVDDE